jgi:hypothetical protein
MTTFINFGGETTLLLDGTYLGKKHIELTADIIFEIIWKTLPWGFSLPKTS